MNTYVFSEVKGKNQGHMAEIKANSFAEAIELFGGVDDKIPAFKKFEKNYFSGMYTVSLKGSANPEYVVHTTRDLDNE